MLRSRPASLAGATFVVWAAALVPAALALPRHPLTGCNGPILTSGRPHRSNGAPSSDLLALLGVLRRAQAPSDLPPAGGGPLLAGPFTASFPSFVRLLSVGPDAEHVYLVPTTPAPLRIPAACLRTLSPRIRQRILAQERLDARRRHPTVAEIFRLEDDGSGSGGGGGDAGQIGAGQAIGLRRSIFRPVTLVSGLVPDGIATVTLSTPGNPALALAVAGNYVQGEMPAARTARVSVAWLTAGGATAKTYTLAAPPPVPGTG